MTGDGEWSLVIAQRYPGGIWYPPTTWQPHSLARERLVVPMSQATSRTQM
jgi:hypothetical protein